MFLSLSLFFWVSLLTAGYSFAADEPQKIESGKANTIDANTVEVSKDEWEHFAPPRDEEFDWLQLNSGEWLKGELISLYSFSLEFDSDELNLLKIDWEDVQQVRSAGPMSLLIEKNEDEAVTVIGVLQLKKNTAVVLTDGQVQVFDRRQIVSIAKGSGKEADLWQGKISFGANVKRGNSDSVDGNLTALAVRRTSESRFSIDYVGNYSKTEDIETSNNHRLNSFYDVFFNSRFFWRTYTAEYYRDTFKNIDRQFSLGTSAGYHLIKTSKTEWDISSGLGSVRKRFVSVGAGEDIESRSPYLEFGTELDTEITSWMDYLFDFKFQLVDENSGTYTHHLVSTLSTDITGDLDLDVTLVWDRVARPQPAADMTVPDKDDFQMIVSISYEF